MTEKSYQSLAVRFILLILGIIGLVVVTEFVTLYRAWELWDRGQQRCSYSHYVEPYQWHCKGTPLSYEYDITQGRSPNEKYFVSLYSQGEEIVINVQEAISETSGKTIFQYTYTHYADVFVNTTTVEWKTNSEEFAFDYYFTYKGVRTECMFTYNIPKEKFVLQCTNPNPYGVGG